MNAIERMNFRAWSADAIMPLTFGVAMGILVALFAFIGLNIGEWLRAADMV